VGWLTDWAPEVTGIAAAVFFVAGIVCCIRVWRRKPKKKDPEIVFGLSMGIALLSSGFLAFAVLLLQGLVEDAAKAEEETARAEQVAADTEQAIALTTSISGFNAHDLPPGVKLKELNFKAKTLNGAQLKDADLAGVNFQDASLTHANLERADLSEANLIGVDLTDADLTGADLSGADLRGARLEHTGIEYAKSLKGAKVNSETCWPQGFLRSDLTKRLAAGLVSPQGTLKSSEEKQLAIGLVSPRGTDAPPLVSNVWTADVQWGGALWPLADGEFGQTCTQEPTTVIRTQHMIITDDQQTLSTEDDRTTFQGKPPQPGARVQRIDWPTSTVPTAYVTWIVEPPDR
jgi:Pentapeptide repeats (8 copies)